jgi:hypothetical protein
MADPITAGALIFSAVGAGVSAAGTIAGGNTQSAALTAAGQNANALGLAQQNEDNYQAAQITENASSEIGAGQRQMLDTQQKTRLAESTLTAGAAASGFSASSGSPLALSTSIARRGSYEAAMNLFNGENASTGDLNRAAGLTYSGDIAAIGGQMQQEGDEYGAEGATIAADYGAIGNLASAGGSMFKTYGTMSNAGSGVPAGVGSIGGNSYVAYG